MTTKKVRTLLAIGFIVLILLHFCSSCRGTRCPAEIGGMCGFGYPCGKDHTKYTQP